MRSCVVKIARETDSTKMITSDKVDWNAEKTFPVIKTTIVEKHFEEKKMREGKTFSH